MHLSTKLSRARKSNRAFRGRRTSQSRSLPSSRILFLQRTIGNRAVQRLFKSGVIQPRLRIGRPGDRYEQEADRVADQVMRMPEPRVQRQPEEEKEEEFAQTKPLAEQITPLVQRQAEPEEEEEKEPIQTKPLAEQNTPAIQKQVEPEEEEEEEPLQTKSLSADHPIVQKQGEEEEEEEPIQPKSLADQITPLVQRQAEPEEEEEEEPIQTKLTDNPQLQRQEEEPEEEEEEPIQTKQGGGKTPRVSHGLQAQIHSLKGGGQPLPKSERAFFEPRFGQDFSQVRIHNDSRAAEAAQAVNAKAFTTGQDVVFGSGQYAPETHKGRQLLAHELTHTVQQQPGPSLTAQRTVQLNLAPVGALKEKLRRQPIEEEEKKKTLQAKELPSQTLEVTPNKELRRQPMEEEEELIQALSENAGVQRQFEEEEEEGPIQAKVEDNLMQRQMDKEEEEEQIQTKVGSLPVQQSENIRTQRETEEEIEKSVRMKAEDASYGTRIRSFNKSKSIIMPRAAPTPTTAEARKMSVADLIAKLRHYKIFAINTLIGFLYLFRSIALGRDSRLKTQKVWRRLKDPNIYRAYQEARGDLRKLIIILVSWSRKIIGSLTVGELGVSKNVLSAIKGFYYEQLSGLTPYYTQMANISILSTGKKKAWRRTCNITSLSMALEGSGVNITDFSGDRGLLVRIARQLDNTFTSFDDLQALRMPDFLQFVVVYIEYQRLSGSARHSSTEFSKLVDVAKASASGLIIKPKMFNKVANLFGMKATVIRYPMYKAITGIAKRAKAIKKKIKVVKRRMRRLRRGAKRSELAKRLRALREKFKNLAPRLPVLRYKRWVIRKIQGLLASGKQIVVNKLNHYARLEKVEARRIVVDDPADRGKNARIPWSQAYREAFFRKFIVLEKK